MNYQRKTQLRSFTNRRGLRTFLLTLGATLLLACLIIAGVIVRWHSLPAKNNAEYVALGSSFAAGPGDVKRSKGSLALCFSQMPITLISWRADTDSLFTTPLAPVLRLTMF